MTMSALSLWWLQYITGPKTEYQGGPVAVGTQTQKIEAGQPVKVPSTQDLFRPTNGNITLGQLPEQVESITVKTEKYTAVFSTAGALLESLAFNRHTDKHHTPLQTINLEKSTLAQRVQQGSFLLALDKETPVAYKCIRHEEKKGKTVIEFATEVDNWIIMKQYTLHHATYSIDLTMSFTPKNGAKLIRPRIFVQAPYVQEVDGSKADGFSINQYVSEALARKIDLFSWNENKNELEKTDLGKHVNLVWHWETTKTLFGSQDKYFVHALVADAAKFVQRAYVHHAAPKKKDEKQVPAMIFEGPAFEKAAQWTLSFYMGPKLSQDLGMVDERLENLLSYGWLSWLCKLLMQWLLLLYSLLGNFGFAILALAFLLKLPFTPFSIYARKKQEEYQRYLPTINKIRLKYRHDQKLQTEEVMRFHQEHNLSPAAPMIGCLPLLIQLPIAMALYKVLGSHLALYNAPFYGWIIDLSAKDPYYVIPTLMGATMIWQNLTMPQPDEKQRFIAMFFSLVMAVVFASLPAGLALYWFATTLFAGGEDVIRRSFFK